MTINPNDILGVRGLYNDGDPVVYLEVRDRLTMGLRLVALRNGGEHSPSGHSWGYGGSGPMQLVLDLLLALALPDEYKRAMRSFVVALDRTDGWRIDTHDLVQALTEQVLAR